MLTLSRKKDQTIMVGDDITIIVRQVSGKTVRIGIDAPREVRISRGETRLPRPKKQDDADG